jgi:cell division transport system permease protein
MNLFLKALSLSLKNIWRNKILSLATISVIGIIIFIFNVILAINFIAEDAIDQLNSKVDVVLYLKDSTDYLKTQTIIQKIEAQAGVKSVTYTSKEDALDDLQKTHPDLSLAFEKYNLGNPLPASLNVATENPEVHANLEDFLNQESFRGYLSNISKNDQNQNSSILSSVSTNLMKVTDFTRQIIFWLIITFVIGGTLVILNALQITIFTRKKEISVMKLVGASPWFLRLPFLIESLFFGLLAVLLSFLLLFLVSQNLEIEITRVWDYFWVELIFTIILSVSSSLIAVHEHLKEIK